MLAGEGEGAKMEGERRRRGENGRRLKGGCFKATEFSLKMVF
jgi:hypothetical protein